MSDVLQNAMKYRDQLNGQIAKVDGFICFAEELTSKHTSEEYTPLVSAATTAIPQKPQAEEISLKPQVEEPSPEAVNAVTEAETTQAEAKPALDKNERPSLFRSALERSNRSQPSELDRRKIGG
ncbi:MAG TPA: hypothetical protein VMX97_05410 [Hyphomicrobiaceae bacterium]|nr:hypothetical protein [Hyphomicrobiaceae bacterium]